MAAVNERDFRSEGNIAYKDGNYLRAVEYYENALQNEGSHESEEIDALLSNLGACYLKMEEYNKVIVYTSESLEKNPNNVKSLFRRCIAYEKLKMIQEAYSDSKQLLRLDRNSKIIRDLARNITEKLNLQTDLYLDDQRIFMELLAKLQHKNSTDSEKIHSDFLNLIRMPGRVRKLYTPKNIDDVIQLLQNPLTRIVAIKALVIFLNNDHLRCEELISKIGIEKLKSIFQNSNGCVVLEISILIRSFLQSYFNHVLSKTGKPNEHASGIEHSRFRASFVSICSSIPLVKALCELLIQSTLHLSVDAKRKTDVIVNIIHVLSLNSFIPYLALEYDWPKKLIISSSTCYNKQCNSELVNSFQYVINYLNYVATALGCFSDIINNEKAPFDKFIENVYSAISEVIKSCGSSSPSFLASSYPILEFSVNISNEIFKNNDGENTERLLNSCEILFNEHKDLVTEENLSNDIILLISEIIKQCLSAKLFYQLSNAKDRVLMIFEKYLTDFQSDLIKIYGLCVLCKLVARDLTTNYELAINLYNSTKTIFLQTGDSLLRSKAVECLSFLSISGDVKELFVHDKELMDFFYQHIAKITVKSTVNLTEDSFISTNGYYFSLCSLLANLVNVGFPEKVIHNESNEILSGRKELKKLAKATGQPIPEENEKDKKKFVMERLRIFSNDKIISFLSKITKILHISVESTHSVQNHYSYFYIASLFNKIVENPEIRGVAVQFGAVKALLLLTISLTIGDFISEGDKAYKEYPYIAAQALARIAITTDPVLSFHGERAHECLRPFLCIVDFRQSPLRRLEGFMALTNIVSLNEGVRSRFLKVCKSFSSIETGIFDTEPMIQRSAVELTTNMMMSQEFVLKYFTPQEDCQKTSEDRNREHIRVLVLLSGDLEDVKTASAASGALALLSYHESPSKAILELDSFYEAMEVLIASNDDQLVYRALYIIKNIVSHNETFARKIVDSTLFLLLQAIDISLNTKVHENKSSREILSEIFDICGSYGLVMKNTQTNS